MKPGSPQRARTRFTPLASRLCAATLALLVATGPGCTREEPSSASATTTSTVSAKAPTVSRSPSATVKDLHDARWSGQHKAMLALIVPEQRDAVLSLVLAVDQLIAAEDMLQQALRNGIGEGSAERFRQRRQVANIIGPLSRDVEVVGEHIDGDHAEVTIQIAGRVPLERVELVHRDAGWLVQTDDPIPGLADALKDLAAVTRRFAGDVKRSHYDAATAEHELELRQTPVLRRIAQLTADARGKHTDDPTP
ncbi:MAG: hypothetical protein H6816_07085 [Phycisphaerales bacterium]|nr:hypothetical protein [Phycisphaerales bacterium]